MLKFLKIIFWSLCIVLPQITIAGTNPTENLAFKLMEKKAAEYEQALGNTLNQNLAKYISKDRFHISVRIYWNPEMIESVKMENSKLSTKKRKLPGFPIFLSEEEQSLNYYLGTKNVMRLQVNVLLDESLPESYSDFIKQFIPIQARFVPERGDYFKIIRIQFPEFVPGAMGDATMDGVPLVSGNMAASDFGTLQQIKNGPEEPTIIHPVLQKYMLDYEKYMKDKISGVLSKYIDPQNFVINAKVEWNKAGLKKLQKTLFVDQQRDKIKLPGFKLYLEKQKETFEIISNSASLMKQDITVLLNNKVTRKTAKFVSNIIPLSIKFSPERGDRINILFDEFPEKPEEKNPQEQEDEDPIADNEELRQETLEKYDNSLQADKKLDLVNVSKKDTQLDIKTSMILLKAREFFYKDDLNNSLEKVLEAIRLDSSSAKAYEMLGSIYYRLNWEELAAVNWRKSLELNPDNDKLREYLDRIDGDRTAENQ